jgi:hypothetical protein
MSLLLLLLLLLLLELDSSVGIATGCGLQGRDVGVRVPVGSRIFPLAQRPDQLWSPPRGDSFPEDKVAGA